MTDHLTQADIGNHLDMDQSRVSRLMERGILPRAGSLDDARRAYIRHLREQAAGRGGDGQGRLVEQRARQAEADANLKEIEYWTRVGELVPVREMQPLLEAWAVAARAETENVVDRILTAIESRYGIVLDRDEVDADLGSAFTAIAAYPTRESAELGSGPIPQEEVTTDD